MADAGLNYFNSGKTKRRSGLNHSSSPLRRLSSNSVALSALIASRRKTDSEQTIRSSKLRSIKAILLCQFSDFAKQPFPKILPIL